MTGTTFLLLLAGGGIILGIFATIIGIMERAEWEQAEQIRWRNVWTAEQEIPATRRTHPAPTVIHDWEREDWA